MRRAFLGNKETQASRKQRPGHVWKGEQQQRASAERVDRPNCWPGENEVDQAEAKRCNKCVSLRGACVDEHGAGVERDDVDTALGSLASTQGCATSIWRHTICCAIMTVKDAKVARRTRGLVKSWRKRVT